MASTAGIVNDGRRITPRIVPETVPAENQLPPTYTNSCQEPADFGRTEPTPRSAVRCPQFKSGTVHPAESTVPRLCLQFGKLQPAPGDFSAGRAKTCNRPSTSTWTTTSTSSSTSRSNGAAGRPLVDHHDEALDSALFRPSAGRRCHFGSEVVCPSAAPCSPTIPATARPVRLPGRAHCGLPDALLLRPPVSKMLYSLSVRTEWETTSSSGFARGERQHEQAAAAHGSACRLRPNPG